MITLDIYDTESDNNGVRILALDYQSHRAGIMAAAYITQFDTLENGHIMMHSNNTAEIIGPNGIMAILTTSDMTPSALHSSVTALLVME